MQQYAPGTRHNTEAKAKWTCTRQIDRMAIARTAGIDEPVAETLSKLPWRVLDVLIQRSWETICGVYCGAWTG